MAFLNRIPWLYGLGLLAAACQATPSENDFKVEERDGSSTVTVGSNVVHKTRAKIDGAALVKLDGSKTGTQVLTWNETSSGSTTPYFAVHDGRGWHAAKTTSYQVPLRNRRIDPLREVQSKNLDAVDSNLHIVQYVSQPLSEFWSAVAAAGGEVHQYLHGNAQIVRADAKAIERISHLPFVRAITPMKATDKIDGELANSLKDRGPVGLVILLVDPARDRAAVEEHVRAIGGTFKPGSEGILVEAEVARSQVGSVARLDQVLWVQTASAPQDDFENARVQGGANYLEASPPPIPDIPNYTGVGIRGHIMEGITPTHGDFAANDYRVAPIAVEDPATTSHGHQTFGIVFGSGAGNAIARGILPNGQGYYTNYNAVFSKPVGERSRIVGDLINTHKVMFQTASWGYNRIRTYDARAAEMDALIFQHDIPITQSQSNAGNQDSRPQAWAKNIISVGAVYHFNTTNPGDDKWNSGGSTGPAADGSLKPDLCAYYDQTLTAAQNGGYAQFGGTSGATPMVAGYVGLTIELWTNGVFGNPIIPREEGESLVDYRFKNRPHASTTKALLINSAAQYAFSGATHDLTRTHQGWGFPDVKNLYDRRSNLLIVNESDVLTNLQSKTYTKTVEAGATDFRATLVYADKEATVPATIHRVNNLDLKITAPDGTVYWGNNGLKEGTTSTAGGVHNTLDTVENVLLANPAAGDWTIEVIADELNADTHGETAEVDADYALVVSSGAPPAPPAVKK